MSYGLWDFGIYDSMLHNTAFGKGFMHDFRGPFDHFSPATLLLVPFYWIFDSPLVLVTFQSLVMALAAFPLYRIAKHYFHKPEIPLLISAMYLLNPYYSRIALYDFHIECLFPLVFFSAWLLFAKNRLWQCIALLVCIPLIKEDFVIPLGACGLFFCFRKKTFLHGVICIAVAGLWTLFVLKVWFPVIMDVKYQHYGRFPPVLGSGIEDTLNNIWFLIKQVLSRDSLAVLLSLLLPFAFFPLFSWRAFILLMVPTLGIHLCSSFMHQRLLISHYSSALIAVVPIAAVFGARQLFYLLKKHKKTGLLEKYVIGCSIALMVVIHIVFCDLPGIKYYSYTQDYKLRSQFGVLSFPLWNYWFVQFEHAALFQELRVNIPKESTITAQNNLGYFFVRNRKVYAVPGPEEGSDLYIFDTKTFFGYDRPWRMNKMVKWLRTNKNYKCLFSKDGIYLFGRKNTAN
jgi:uncharacterized membrane protein